MDRDRKKRKVLHKAEEDKEAKMEKFFALIKNTRDLRDSLLGREQLQGKKKAEVDQRPTAPIWQPSFETEDFGEDALSKSDPTTAEAGPSSSRRQEETRKERKGNENSGSDLDLNLSL